MNDFVCATEKTLLVTVAATPVANFRSPAVICENESGIVFQDFSYIPGGQAIMNKWWWEIDGNITNSNVPAAFNVNGTGGIRVRLAVNTSLGCRSDTLLRMLPVRHKPEARFSYSSPLCDNETILFRDESKMPSSAAEDYITKWYWQFDQGPVINTMNPSYQFTNGNRHVKLTAESNYGCKSVVADTLIFIHQKPNLHLAINDSCVRRLIRYDATDSRGDVTKWLWNFGTGLFAAGPSHTRTYANEAQMRLTVIGVTDHGCKDTIIRPFRIFENKSDAGTDTIVAKNEPVHLDAKGGGGVRYYWTPLTGLDNPNAERPVATLDHDQVYKLYTISKEGCDTYDQVYIKRYAGPELYIPNAFTPDNDGTNDQLKVFPVGIRKFNTLVVYTRNGQEVFRTSNYQLGWNGYFNGKKMGAGTYIAVAQAEDYRGKAIMKKTTVLLLR
jgi:gliding motility-associated-like protein